MADRTKIRVRMQNQHLSFVWMVDQLDMRGVRTDKTEISSAFSGTRSGAKVEQILNTCEEILDDYENGKVRTRRSYV